MLETVCCLRLWWLYLCFHISYSVLFQAAWIFLGQCATYVSDWYTFAFTFYVLYYFKLPRYVWDSVLRISLIVKPLLPYSIFCIISTCLDIFGTVCCVCLWLLYLYYHILYYLKLPGYVWDSVLRVSLIVIPSLPYSVLFQAAWIFLGQCAAYVYDCYTYTTIFCII